ncbi:calcineurin-like phosphoesterase [Metarhizium robertsii]|uniref:Ser/Thr protein phosphatase n=2 Tax=Metarhizium robertsii TaxID=568076 RepID=E9FB57_METRA|nr:Ser/Thr protein phosphatase [Metarhizium robertsii ARSEF 23]EFY95057.1 Ser/Thr protein phosphatase [Metarhizium robertsii ARSEF 23]EXU96493.1 calcineurin-like phosphoesterase [Metarhizium robertsii]
MKTFLSTILKCQGRSSRPRIQLLSDLHLEVGQQYLSYTFPASAPFLLLGGDIGRLIDYDGYLKFLEAQVSRYQNIFLVLGNHEFYGLDYHAGLKEARRLVEEPSLADSVILLDKTRWDDPDSALTIIGCTLWSAIPEETSALIESKINDFKKIDGWSAQTHNEVHAKEAAWLREKVAQAAKEQSAKRQLLIATHHAPCVEGTSAPRDSNNPWTPAFATDLLDQEGWAGIHTWAFGHTHYSTELVRKGVRLVANQRGYVLPGSMTQKLSGKSHNFDPGMTIEL